MGPWTEVAALVRSWYGNHRKPGVIEASPESAKGISRRQFLAIGASMAAGGGLRQSELEDLISPLVHRRHVEPYQGEALPLEFMFNPNRRVFEPSPFYHRRLFLTFDDGPLHCTGHILDLLAATGNKATFFVIGRNLATPKLRAFAVRALKEGHDLANHSYTHPDFSTISTKRAKEEIVATYHLIREVVEEAEVAPQRQNLFFRFPYGVAGSRANHRPTEEVLTELNYATAWWDLDTNDWRMELAWLPRPSSKVVASLNQARPSDVVLLHDRNATAKLLPEMLKALEHRHLVSAPLSQYELDPRSVSGEGSHDSVPTAESPRAEDSDDLAAELLKSIFPRTESTVVPRGIFSDQVFPRSRHW